MTINTEDTLAFKVCQLIVDENSGEITPVMREDNNGGFFKKGKANTRGLYEIAYVHISCAYGEGFSLIDHKLNAIVF